MELFQFGVVADVQYADKDNIRDCRFDSALAVITRSVFALNRCEALEFVVQLGDLIDGNRSVESTKVDANAVMDVFQNLHWPLKHVIGNHCRRLPLSYLTKLLNLPPCAYHVFQPHPQWRVVVLNGAENYVEAVDRTDAEVTLVREICRRTGADLIPWNGAIGSDQIAWFRSQLQASRSLGENVIVLCHFPLVKEAAASTHVLLNAEEILDVMDEYAHFSNDHLQFRDSTRGRKRRKKRRNPTDSTKQKSVRCCFCSTGFLASSAFTCPVTTTKVAMLSEKRFLTSRSKQSSKAKPTTLTQPSTCFRTDPSTFADTAASQAEISLAFVPNETNRIGKNSEKSLLHSTQQDERRSPKWIRRIREGTSAWY